MRKSIAWIVWIILMIGMLITGCGTVTQESVLNDLQSIEKNLKTYKSKAMMTVQTSDIPQKYYIETWFQSPSLYRIALGDEKREITQVIVRNNEGIYVINPQLKKSFRFKGEWAENQGHVYLYHAMIHQILQAKEKTFKQDENTVSFDIPVKENPLIVHQKIVLDERKLDPRQILLFDKSDKAIVNVTYEEFKTGVKFADDDFTPEKVMALADPKHAIPAMTHKNDFGIIEPTYVPKGFERKDTIESDDSVLLRYSGEQGAFTLKETRSSSLSQALVGGNQLVDLFGAPAVVTGAGNAKTIYWTRNGVEFALTGSLPVQEMMKIAASMIDATGK
jgi:outer membrane lipoprotein-sorting protein